MSSGRSTSPKSSRRGTSYRRKKKKKKKTKLTLPKISNDEQLMMDRMKKYWYDSCFGCEKSWVQFPDQPMHVIENLCM